MASEVAQPSTAVPSQYAPPQTTITGGGPKVVLRTPAKFASSSSVSSTSHLVPPSLEWLERTWTVTASTLPMWRKAKNVRITYKVLPPVTEGGPVRLDDLVESVPTERTWMPQPKQVRGVDTLVVGEDGEGWRWDWRGKGLLKIATSKWELLGYGEITVDNITEKWAVTYFEATLFTPQGVDIYTDRREGISKGLFQIIEKELEAIEGGGVGVLCKKDMQRVLVDDA